MGNAQHSENTSTPSLPTVAVNAPPVSEPLQQTTNVTTHFSPQNHVAAPVIEHVKKYADNSLLLQIDEMQKAYKDGLIVLQNAMDALEEERLSNIEELDAKDEENIAELARYNILLEETNRNNLANAERDLDVYLVARRDEHETLLLDELLSMMKEDITAKIINKMEFIWQEHLVKLESKNQSEIIRILEISRQEYQRKEHEIALQLNEEYYQLQEKVRLKSRKRPSAGFFDWFQQKEARHDEESFSDSDNEDD